MSHFSVLVIGGNPEEQLAPYQENNMGDCPEQYLEFFDVTDEYLKEYQENPEHQKEYPNFEAFMHSYSRYEKNDDGRYGYRENPNKKWDWYQLGGRFGNSLILKDGRFANQAKAKDISWQMMEERRRIEAERDWQAFTIWLNSENRGNCHTHFKWGVQSDKEKKDEYESKESFMERRRSFTTFAVVKDKQWAEKGSMGWWACVSNEKPPTEWQAQFRAIIESLNEDELVSVYDCHI